MSDADADVGVTVKFAGWFVCLSFALLSGCAGSMFTTDKCGTGVPPGDFGPIRMGENIFLDRVSKLGPNDIAIVGRIVGFENGERKVASDRWEPHFGVRQPPMVDWGKVRCYTYLRTFAGSDMFFYILPAGKYEIFNVWIHQEASMNFEFQPFLEFDASEPGVAYYLGDIVVDFDTPSWSEQYVSSAVKHLNYLEVVDRYDEVRARVLASLHQMEKAPPVRKALATRNLGLAPWPQPGPKLPDGRVAVVAARHAPEAHISVYARGKTAAAKELRKVGREEGARSYGVGYGGGDPISLALLVLSEPVRREAGKLAGEEAAQKSAETYALSDEQATKVSALVDQAIHQLGISEQVARRVVERASRSGRQVELVPDAGPSTPKEARSYTGLSGQYDALLEVVVDKVGMAARRGNPPRLALEFQMHARVVDWKGKGAAGIRTMGWAARPRPFPEWTSASAELLAVDFEEGYDTLAQYVWEMVFPEP